MLFKFFYHIRKKPAFITIRLTLSFFQVLDERTKRKHCFRRRRRKRNRHDINNFCLHNQNVDFIRRTKTIPEPDSLEPQSHRKVGIPSLRRFSHHKTQRKHRCRSKINTTPDSIVPFAGIVSILPNPAQIPETGNAKLTGKNIIGDIRQLYPQFNIVVKTVLTDKPQLALTKEIFLPAEKCRVVKGGFTQCNRAAQTLCQYDR